MYLVLLSKYSISFLINIYLRIIHISICTINFQINPKIHSIFNMSETISQARRHTGCCSFTAVDCTPSMIYTIKCVLLGRNSRSMSTIHRALVQRPGGGQASAKMCVGCARANITHIHCQFKSAKKRNKAQTHTCALMSDCTLLAVSA